MTLLTETSSDKASASSYDKGTSEYLPSEFERVSVPLSSKVSQQIQQSSHRIHR